MSACVRASICVGVCGCASVCACMLVRENKGGQKITQI